MVVQERLEKVWQRRVAKAGIGSFKLLVERIVEAKDDEKADQSPKLKFLSEPQGCVLEACDWRKRATAQKP